MLAVILSLLVAQVTPAPSASPTASACSHDADVLKAEVPDTMPDSEGDKFAIVAVQVAPDGTVVKAKIYRTSGDLLFDQASVRAARHSTFTPKVVDCKPVEGTVYFRTSLTQGYPPEPGASPTPPPWPRDMSPPPDR